MFFRLTYTICVKLVKGEDSFQYIIDRTLMRPRALIDCIKDCIGVAINRGHEKIQSAYYQLYPTFVIDDKFFEV